MTISKKLMLSATALSALFILSACGEDDSSTASAPASAPAADSSMESAPAASGSDPLAGVERAEGVVYMDEIYAGWPYN